MKRLMTLLLTGALLLAGAMVTLAAERHLADLPDPLVGTDSKYELSRGNTYPATFRPFGALGWTAQTGEGGWPYQFDKDSIHGFLATHRPSAWMSDYGPFSLMPVVGELKVKSTERGAKFTHANEEARAWRYSVQLSDSAKVEVTPVAHGGVIRITFPKSGAAWLVWDAQKGGSAVTVDAASKTITGYNKTIHGRFPDNFAQHVVASFDQPFTAQGTWDEAGRSETTTREGAHVGAYVGFAPGSTVTIRIAVSLISLEQARENLKSEIGTASFDTVAAAARAQWDKELGRFELKGGTADEQRTFYTCVYRAFQTPHAIHETTANGVKHYSPYDGKIHDGELYADNGFWDTFRAQFPLLALMQPKLDAAIIRGLLNAMDEGGWIPKWPNPGYTNVMIGTHADSVIADAYIKGIRDFDAAKAYKGLHRNATEPGTGRYHARSGIEEYLKLGYVAADKTRESVSCSLEYAYDDFCVAQMARALGHDDDYRTFMEHSQKYRNLYDASTGFMRGRNSDGKWVEPFDPLAWGGVFTEGNAHQWVWSVQHDVKGLMELMGGRDKFVERLDNLFTMTNDFHVGGYGKVIHEMTEAKMANTGQYAHINEPVHHVLYLYDYAGQPWKTQKWTREIMDRFYKPGPSGWLGDEDTGQMSSWYIFSALGFYPVNPAQPIYALTSPVFDRASLRLENGKTFTVEAKRQSAKDVYIQAATLNGKPLDRCWISHEEIVGGGVLSFRLGSTPNTKWGIGGVPPAR